MLTVNYAANGNDTGTVVIDCDSMTDVVTLVEKSFGIKLTPISLSSFLMGSMIEGDSVNIWFHEESN
jgi:riboflavin synthase alpha subunit